MFFIQEEERSRNALTLIKQVLDSHIDMLNDREEELVSLASQDLKKQINEMLQSKDFTEINGSTNELDLLAREIEVLDIKIAAIQYTYDYVKLMLNQCKISSKDI